MKGKLVYNVAEFLYCKTWTGTSCFEYDGQTTINFIHYALDTNNTQIVIQEELILHTGQENVLSSGLNISPNPFISTIHVESKQFAHFHLSTLQGQVLKSNLPTNTSIDLSGLQSGMYIAQFGNSIVHKRVVKQ